MGCDVSGYLSEEVITFIFSIERKLAGINERLNRARVTPMNEATIAEIEVAQRQASNEAIELALKALAHDTAVEGSVRRMIEKWKVIRNGDA